MSWQALLENPDATHFKAQSNSALVLAFEELQNVRTACFTDAGKLITGAVGVVSAWPVSVFAMFSFSFLV